MNHHQFLSELRKEFPADLNAARKTGKADPRWHRTAEAVLILNEAGLSHMDAVAILSERNFDLPPALLDEDSIKRTGYKYLSRKVATIRRRRNLHRDREATA